MSCSEQDEASPGYEACLRIIIKMKKVAEGGFYLLDIGKAHGDIDLFKDVSENIFEKIDSFLI